MGLTTITEAIAGLRDHGVRVERSMNRYSFGDRKKCRELFEIAFMHCDKTVKEFQYLPEYEQIIQWMMDTKGTGLCLVGDCGRGKSTIIMGVIPTVYYLAAKKILHGYQAFDIPEKVGFILKSWAVLIDEVGTEVQCTGYGGNYEGFNRIMDNAEAELKPVFISTNLTKDQIEARYGTRTWERLNRLCRVVRFKGESLR